MTDDRMSAPTPEMAKAKITPVEARRFQIGVRALVVLVGCCGILLWALRHLWESSHPAFGAARGLQARSPSERVDAARELMRIGIGDSHDAIPPLVSALNDPEAEVRAAATESLKTVASVAVNAGSAHDLVQESIAALIGSLNDRESAVRMAVVDALATILASKRGGEVVDLESVFAAFTEMLGDPVANIRIAALNGLGTTARMLAVEPPPVLAALLDDESDVVRATALRSVACFQRGLDAWIPMILRALDRDSESVVGQTLPVEVGALRPPAFSAVVLPTLIGALDSRNDHVRICAASLIAALRHEGCPAVPKLIEIVLTPIDSMKTGADQFSQMDWRLAHAVAHALGEIAPGTASEKEVLASLIQILRSGHSSRLNAAAAANALERFGPAAVAAVPVLIQILKADSTTKAPAVDGEWAAYALERIGPDTPLADDAVAALTEALLAESEYTRGNAAGALARFGPKAAGSILRLRSLTNDRSRYVSTEAAKALATLDVAK